MISLPISINFWGGEKSHKARSGKFGGWGTIIVLFLTRNFCTDKPRVSSSIGMVE